MPRDKWGIFRGTPVAESSAEVIGGQRLIRRGAGRGGGRMPSACIAGVQPRIASEAALDRFLDRPLIDMQPGRWGNSIS
jgi:hypothetical protein